MQPIGRTKMSAVIVNTTNRRNVCVCGEFRTSELLRTHHVHCSVYPLLVRLRATFACRIAAFPCKTRIHVKNGEAHFSTSCHMLSSLLSLLSVLWRIL